MDSVASRGRVPGEIEVVAQRPGASGADRAVEQVGREWRAVVAVQGLRLFDERDHRLAGHGDGLRR